MGQEAKSEIYDQIYTADEVNLPIEQSHYYPLFCSVVAEVQKRAVRSVVEVGCGAGSLAELLMTRLSVSYRGFDFSRVAVERAARRTGKTDTFFVADALDPGSYRFPYDGIVCTEVLEHITRDLDVISMWKSGTVCVCSVPNFDMPEHVRYFRHEDELRDRYGRHIDIDTIIRVPRPIFAGITLEEYLRKLRWARDEPKRLLGMLGINTFDWYAGWFVFAGVRTARTR